MPGKAGWGTRPRPAAAAPRAAAASPFGEAVPLRGARGGGLLWGTTQAVFPPCLCEELPNFLPKRLTDGRE